MHYNTTGLPPKTTGSATKREGYMPGIMQQFAKSYHALLVDFLVSITQTTLEPCRSTKSHY